MANFELASRGLPVPKRLHLAHSLPLPPGMTLAAVIKNNQVTLVGGNTKIEEGDFVVVFCLNGTISKIEKWFY